MKLANKAETAGKDAEQARSSAADKFEALKVAKEQEMTDEAAVKEAKKREMSIQKKAQKTARSMQALKEARKAAAERKVHAEIFSENERGEPPQ